MPDVADVFMMVFSIVAVTILAFLLTSEVGEYDTKQEVCGVYEEWCVD